MSIEAIERAAAIAWPAIERTTMGEWVVCAGDGFSRRRNSVVPVGAIPDELEGRLSDVTSWYEARGLDTLYRITPLCDPAIDQMLAARGFAFETPTLVMSRSLQPEESPINVAESPIATEDWIAAELSALDIDRSLTGPWLSAIEAVPSPAAFVTVGEGTSTAGAGLGVVIDRLLGVFEVAVHPQHRRRGHARSIMSALHSFGLREGAETVFLQVIEEDDATVSLYQSLGYEISHRYWYRRAVA